MPGENAELFIIKIWVEPISEDGTKIIWRGHITHALTREKSYVQSSNDILDFIKSYIDKTGVEVINAFTSQKR